SSALPLEPKPFPSEFVAVWSCSNHISKEPQRGSNIAWRIFFPGAGMIDLPFYAHAGADHKGSPGPGRETFSIAIGVARARRRFFQEAWNRQPADFGNAFASRKPFRHRTARLRRSRRERIQASG